MESTGPVEPGGEGSDMKLVKSNRGHAVSMHWRGLRERRDAALNLALSYEAHSVIPFLSGDVPVLAYEQTVEVGAGLVATPSQGDMEQAPRPAVDVVLTASHVQVSHRQTQSGNPHLVTSQPLPSSTFIPYVCRTLGCTRSHLAG